LFVFFKARNDTKRLTISLEPAVLNHSRVQRFFPAVAEWGMSEVMRKTSGFDEITRRYPVQKFFGYVGAP